MFIRAIIKSVTEGVIKRFSAGGRADETIENREVFDHYGFTSRPLAGAEAILVKDGNNIIMIASEDRRYRLALQNGEVALYTDEGDCIHLKRGEIYIKGNGKITVDSGGDLIINASSKFQINGSEINLAGNRADMRRLIDERFRQLFNTHTHPATFGNTGVPNQTLEYVDHATDKMRTL